MALKEGEAAPDFSLPATTGQKVSLSSFRGKAVVLVFYPADWSPVCTDELALYSELMPEFDALGASILGLSVDGLWSHKAYVAERKYTVPLLADFHPHGAVAKAYQVFREEDGTSERALFVIDGSGRVHWSYVSPIDRNPGADGLLAVLESLKKKEGARLAGAPR
jgi:peroxiredoxin